MASTTRQALLQALSAAEGAYISGQQLAQQLWISQVRCLRNPPYVISVLAFSPRLRYNGR